MQTGTLKIRDVSRGKEYRVEFVNAKGRDVSFPIMPADRLFDTTRAETGDTVQFELAAGRPVKCVIPGKEAPAPETAPKRPPLYPRIDQSRASSGNSSGFGKGNFSSGNGALANAVAPYNFVPFYEAAILPAFSDEKGIWSGRIVCTLTALTPLLVSGAQKKAADEATECRFQQVEGENIIPGTAIKGMLRSLLEILSFSRMLPVTHKHLFWRRVISNFYRGFFEQDKPLGGYLRKSGADYYLVPVEVKKHKHPAPEIAGWETVQTGGIKTKRGRSCDYHFAIPPQNARAIAIDRKVVDRFVDQLTPNQEKRWDLKTRNERMRTHPGLPVFYRQDEQGNILELGFCRYFRLKYKYSPHELAYPHKGDEIMDLAARLFGSTGKESFRGRVSVAPAVVKGALYREAGLDVVLGGPKPTCLPLYLEQNSTGNSKGNRLKSYNDPDARLRGYKMYWHHDVDPQFFPGLEQAAKGDDRNKKVMSRLFPLKEGASATVVINVDHLTDTELGGLLEALELPDGHAHKLGMGKSLGLGSVRLRVEKAEIVDMGSLHSSLSRRLGQDSCHPLDKEKIASLKEHFRRRILGAVTARHTPWKNITSYDSLPPIRSLRIMMDYKNRPAPAKVRTMPLAQFARNAILPTPAEVIR